MYGIVPVVDESDGYAHTVEKKKCVETVPISSSRFEQGGVGFERAEEDRADPGAR